MNLSSAITGPSGKVSAMRVSTLGCVFIPLVLWAYLSVRNGSIQHIDPEVLGVIIAGLGGKVWQRGKEVESYIDRGDARGTAGAPQAR